MQNTSCTLGWWVKGKAWRCSHTGTCSVSSCCGSCVSVSFQDPFWGGVTPRGQFLFGKMLSVHLLLSPYSSQYFQLDDNPVISLR